jgi:hypothetical protein
MREGRRRFVPLACVFAVVLAALVVGLGAGAGAPARAAALPLHGIWSDILSGPLNTNVTQYVDVAEGPDGSLYAGGMYNGTLGGDKAEPPGVGLDRTPRCWAGEGRGAGATQKAGGRPVCCALP